MRAYGAACRGDTRVDSIQTAVHSLCRSPSTPHLLAANPGSWAAAVGQDFAAHTALPHIDMATLHLWPDNWQTR